MWKFLIQGLGLMDEDPVDIGGCSVSPRELLFRKIPPTASPKKQIELYKSGKLSSRLMLVCDVTGKKNANPVTYRLWTDSPTGKEACRRIPGSNDVSWMTSVPASIFSLMLLRDQVKHTGVFPPEVFDRQEVELLYQGIKEWGITVIKQTETVV